MGEKPSPKGYGWFDIFNYKLNSIVVLPKISIFVQSASKAVKEAGRQNTEERGPIFLPYFSLWIRMS